MGYFTMDNSMEGGSDGTVRSGFTYELLCEIAAYNHWNIEYVYGDFSELYKQMEEGTVDILPNVIDTEERQQQVLFHSLALNTEHYYISALSTAVPEQDPKPDPLNGKRIATVRDAFEEKYFDEWTRKKGVYFAVSKDRADIVSLSADLVDIVRQSMSKPLTVETDFTAVEHRFVMADVNHRNSILTNVIGNSVKYTPGAGRYDIVLMDIQTPKMNGYEATRAIRALPDARAASIPIVAVTANAFEEDKQNAIDSGMNGHITKPVDVRKILCTLSDILS